VNKQLEQLSLEARRAVRAGDWSKVGACAKEILSRRRNSAEAYFLMGLVDKASNRPDRAVRSFSRAISLDDRRYDAATELASQYLLSHQYGEAVALLSRYESHMKNSPLYLDIAASIYTNVGLPERALPLHERADELQPGLASLRAKLAACNVYVGEIDKAKTIYRELLEKFPNHQRNHYELSRLERATDSTHVDQMKAVLDSTKLTPDKNIYSYYAIGKELEDLEQWDEAFGYYEMAGAAAAGVANYDVDTDVRLIDNIIEVCDEGWLSDESAGPAAGISDKTPVFVVGLPRTGTTLTERILSSHSLVESVGETYFMQIVLKRVSGIKSTDGMNASIVEAAARKDIKRIYSGYLEAVAYKLGDKPMFIDKFPENFLYLGFIAKAFPDARIILLKRNPMDACFAMFKQSFFRYAYTLDDLGRYYVSYNRLYEHWRRVLGGRLIEVQYEDLVSNQESRTRQLLDALDLGFEEACLNFEQNRTASNTASTVQIREKVHTRSVNRWRCFENHLQLLKDYLGDAGISLE